MRNHNTIYALMMGLLLLFAGCATPPRTPVQEQVSKPAITVQQVSKPAITVLGEWKEYWGTPDVTYNDLYRVTQTSGGNVKVQILNRNQKIYDEQLEGMILTFTQHTDTFVVRYSLTLQQDGRWMVGTARTPKQVVNVKWEKAK
ncbi:MAG: hypothetical protein WC789_09825 [Lentisphaeria bacterium]|jgi:hypothetical protein